MTVLNSPPPLTLALDHQIQPFSPWHSRRGWNNGIEKTDRRTQTRKRTGGQSRQHLRKDSTRGVGELQERQGWVRVSKSENGFWGELPAISFP